MKRKKCRRKHYTEFFVLSEQAKQNAEIFAHHLKDDTLSLKAHGLWAVIWFRAQTSSQKEEITLEALCENQKETPLEMQPALMELVERGHITVDEKGIITLK